MWILFFKNPYFCKPCVVVAACRSSSSLARSGLPLLAKQWASWEALGWCEAAGSPLLHMAKTWKAWADRLSPARSFTSWVALRRSRRESTSRAISSSESFPDSHRRRESDRESAKERDKRMLVKVHFLVRWIQCFYFFNRELNIRTDNKGAKATQTSLT